MFKAGSSSSKYCIDRFYPEIFVLCSVSPPKGHHLWYIPCNACQGQKTDWHNLITWDAKPESLLMARDTTPKYGIMKLE